jgi:hypothetical protein
LQHKFILFLISLEQHKNVPNLRVLIAGGDGSAQWVFSVMDEMNFWPPVAILPLGTGLFVYLFNYLLLFVYLFIYLFIYVCMYLFILLHFILFIYLFIHFPI